MRNPKGHRHLLWWTTFVLRAFAVLVCVSAFLEGVGELGPHGGWTYSTLAWFSGAAALAVATIPIVLQPGRIPAIDTKTEVRKLYGRFAELIGMLAFIGWFSSGWVWFVWLASAALLAFTGWFVDRKRLETQLEQEQAPAFYPSLGRQLARERWLFEIDRMCGYVYVQPSDAERSIGKKAGAIVARPYVSLQLPPEAGKSIGKMPPPLTRIPRDFPSDEERRIGAKPPCVRALTWREALREDLLDLYDPLPPPPLVIDDIRKRYVPPPAPRWCSPHWRRSQPDARLLEVQDPDLAPPALRHRKRRTLTAWDRAEYRRRKIRDLLESCQGGQPHEAFLFQDAAD